MKSFYGGMFIKKEDLEKNKIFHPVKLEYYKIKQIDKNQEIFGIEIVKTQYKKDKVIIENKKVCSVAEEETEIDHILDLLKRNEVMPVQLEEILSDRQEKKKQIV